MVAKCYYLPLDIIITIITKSYTPCSSDQLNHIFTFHFRMYPPTQTRGEKTIRPARGLIGVFVGRICRDGTWLTDTLSCVSEKSRKKLSQV